MLDSLQLQVTPPKRRLRRTPNHLDGRVGSKTKDAAAKSVAKQGVENG